jgi:hypothetical protein
MQKLILTKNRINSKIKKIMYLKKNRFIVITNYQAITVLLICNLKNNV